MKRRRRLAATLGLVVLVIVDAALVWAALRIGGRSSAVETPADTLTTAPISTATTTPSTPSPAPSTTGTSATSTAPPANTPGVPLKVIVSAVDGSLAWRATAGKCGAGGAAVQVTTDGGKTWRNRTSPFAVITRVQASDATKGFLVGADSACSMAVRTTSDAGATWPGTGSLADTMARDAKDATKVRAPGGQTVAPCGTDVVVDLARNSTNGAEVLCAGGAIRSSGDDGRTWPESGRVTSGLALDSKVVGGKVTAYVAWTKPGCAGVQISTVIEGNVSDLGCAAAEGVTPGEVALAAPTTDSGWLLVGSATYRSTDGLRTWSKA
jgi:hypothetical protein